MGAEAKRVLDEGLALPDDERRQVAEALLDSLADSSRLEIDPAWRDEVVRRAEGIRSGKVTPVPWSEVRRQIRDARDR